MLVATYFTASLQNGKGTISGGKSSVSFEKGLLTLVSSDAPGLQVTGPFIMFSFNKHYNYICRLLIFLHSFMLRSYLVGLMFLLSLYIVCGPQMISISCLCT